MQNPRRHTDMLGHRSVDTIPEPFASRIEVVQSAASHWIVLTDDGRRFTDDALPLVPTFDATTKLGDAATEFVPQDDRIVDRPRVIGGPLMQVAATNSDIGNFQQDILVSDFRSLDFSNFDAPFFG